VPRVGSRPHTDRPRPVAGLPARPFARSALETTSRTLPLPGSDSRPAGGVAFARRSSAMAALGILPAGRWSCGGGAAGYAMGPGAVPQDQSRRDSIPNALMSL
jgi:hypothetical protein